MRTPRWPLPFSLLQVQIRGSRLEGMKGPSEQACLQKKLNPLGDCCKSATVDTGFMNFSFYRWAKWSQVRGDCLIKAQKGVPENLLRQALELRNDLVAAVYAVQGWEPEFRSPELTGKQGRMQWRTWAYNLCWGVNAERSHRLLTNWQGGFSEKSCPKSKVKFKGGECLTSTTGLFTMCT